MEMLRGGDYPRVSLDNKWTVAFMAMKQDDIPGMSDKQKI